MTTPFQTPRKTATTATANATAAAGYHTPVDATAGPITITLPTAVNAGAHLAIEKIDASTNKVTVSGTIRGAVTTVTLDYRYETLELLAESGSSWRVTSNHLPKAAVDAKIAAQAASDVATYSTLLTAAATYTWNTDGTIATQTVAGATTTYSWNADGSLHTETRNGVTRTYAYNTDGTLASVA